MEYTEIKILDYLKLSEEDKYKIKKAALSDLFKKLKNVSSKDLDINTLKFEFQIICKTTISKNENNNRQNTNYIRKYLQRP